MGTIEVLEMGSHIEAQNEDSLYLDIDISSSTPQSCLLVPPLPIETNIMEQNEAGNLKKKILKQNEAGNLIMQMLKKENHEDVFKKMVRHIKDVRKTGHEAILLELNRMNIGIGDYIKKPNGKKVTVFRIILESVFNGHELIIQILDSLVKKVPKLQCSKCFDTKEDPEANIEIELQPIFRLSKIKTTFERSKMRLINDLLDIQSKSGNDKNTKQIFQHPVIEILILKKWQKHQVVYISKVRLFALFVLLFTFLVRLRLLEEDEKRCIKTVNVTLIPIKLQGNTNLADCMNYLVNTSDWNSGWVKGTFNGTFNQLLIFKYNEISFKSFAVAMGLVLLIQLLHFMWVLMMYTLSKQNVKCSEHKKGRMLHTLTVSFFNIVYILIAFCVCVFSSIPQFKIYILDNFIMICWLFIFFTELHQLCFLVIRPAWEGFNVKSIQRILQNRFFRDPENLLELCCIISIPIALYTDAWARNQLDEHDLKPAILRGVVAIGVFSAWSELFIKVGNISYSVVGDFTKMFYNIIKSKLFAYMQVCTLLMVAFSLAFWIILEGHLKKDGMDFSKGFWFNFILTVTMSTGEFNTGAFYENIGENTAIKVLAMLFLIGLVILSTITMINLLVAAIISDYQTMKDSVDMENLYFITEYIIEVGEIRRLIKRWINCIKSNNYFVNLFVEPFVVNVGKISVLMPIYNYFSNAPKDEDVEKNIKKDEDVEKNMKKDEDVKENMKKMTYCPHRTCNNYICKIDSLPIAKPGWSYNKAMEASEREPLLLRLLDIRKGNKKHRKETDEEYFCVFHKYGILWSGDLMTCRVDDDN